MAKGPQQSKGRDIKNPSADMPDLPEIEHHKLIPDTLVNRIKCNVIKSTRNAAMLVLVSTAGGFAGGSLGEMATQKHITNQLRPSPELVAKIETIKKEDDKQSPTKKGTESSEDRAFWKKRLSDINDIKIIKDIKRGAKESGEEILNDNEILKNAVEQYKKMKEIVDNMYTEYKNREKWLSIVDKIGFFMGFLGGAAVLAGAYLLILKLFGSNANIIQSKNIQIMDSKMREMIDSHNKLIVFVRTASSSGNISLMEKAVAVAEDTVEPMLTTLSDLPETIDSLDEGMNTNLGDEGKATNAKNEDALGDEGSKKLSE